MNKEELMNMSFQIIGYSGEAFSHLNKVMELAQTSKFDDIEQHMKDADECLRKAHQYQTTLIVDETRGKQHDFTILAVHAQDHLMNAILLKSIALQIVELYKRRVE